MVVSHNEWMPEYALLPLSQEEELNKEKLSNPPAIRSSKSNYLIEEHLGIGSASLNSSSPSLVSSLSNTSSDPISIVKKEEGTIHSLSPAQVPLTKGELDTANILASINSFPNYFGINHSGNSNLMELLPPTPPPSDELKQNIAEYSVTVNKNYTSNLRNVTSHANTLARPITPPRFYYAEFRNNFGSNLIGRPDTPLMFFDRSFININPEFRNIQSTHEVTNQITENLLVDNSKLALSNDYKTSKKNTHVISKEMSPATTQIQPEYSRKRRNDPNIKTENSQSERFKLEAEALHALPLSNGGLNPPPITRNNLSQLATAILLATAQLKNNILNIHTNEEELEMNKPPQIIDSISSWLPSKKIKCYDFFKQRRESFPLPSLSPQPKDLPEIQKNLNFLRKKVLDAQKRLANRKQKLPSLSEGESRSETEFRNHPETLICRTYKSSIGTTAIGFCDSHKEFD